MDYKNQNRLWNGWGNSYNPNWVKLQKEDLKNKLLNFLSVHLNKKQSQLNSETREKLLSKIEDSKISFSEVQNHKVLKEIIKFDPEIRFDYSFGQSFPDWIRFRTGWDIKITDAVAFPKTVEEIQAIFEFCKQYDYRCILYGGGTSVVGHILPENEKPTITVSMEKMNRIKEVNKVNSYAIMEAGITGLEIEEGLRNYGYRLGHYPQSFELSTLGGWIATRSSGQQSLYYGRIEDLFLGGKVLTQDGILEIYPNPASSAGPDLKHIILGSEGRLGVIVEAIMKIRPLPDVEEFYGLFFRDVKQAIEFIKKIINLKTAISMIRLSFAEETKVNLEMAKHTGHKKGIEFLETLLNFKKFPDSFLMMILGFTGTKHEVEFSKKIAFRIVKDLKGYVNLFLFSRKLGNSWEKHRFFSPYFRNLLWEIGYGVDTLETCLPWDKILDAKEKIENAIKTASDKFKENVLTYTHLSHVYINGSSLYTTFIFPLKSNPKETYEMWKEIKQSACDTITSLKGTISHQHGVGKDHKPFLIKEKGALGIRWIDQVIQNSDPKQILNNKNLV